MSTTLTHSRTIGSATDERPTFDAAVRSAAERQTARLREFGLRVEQPEQDAYRRLIDRLSS